MDNYSSYEWHASRRQVTPRGESSGSTDRDRREREHERERDKDVGSMPRRPVITRVSRACNACRRAKIRCIGAETPPCERCRTTGAECVLEKPPAKPADQNAMEDRLHNLEDQMTTMRHLLQDVVHAVCPDMGDKGHPGRSPAASVSSEYRSGSGYRPPKFWHRSPDVSANHHNPQPREGPPELQKLRGMGEPHTYEHADEHQNRHGHQHQQAATSPETELGRRRRRSSTPAEDVLAMDEMANPLGVLRTIATRMEMEDSGSPPPKRPRTVPGEGAGAGAGLAHGHGHERGQGLGPDRSEQDRDEDPLSLGLIGADEAAELVQVFYAGSSDFINCYDPEKDSFYALRERSPFGLTAVMMVGARVRDGGGRMSEAQRMCLAAARRIAMKTLVLPGSTVEDVKALILLAAFTDDGWLIAGHAVRLALDLQLNLAFNKLVQRGMGKGRTRAELERDDQALLEQARVWYTVYRLEHQMSYGMGRPAIVQEDDTIHNSRALLDHPLSLDSDVRLIYAVELTSLRAPLHVQITARPDSPLDGDMLSRLSWANEQFDAWERHWHEVLIDRFGPERTGWIRESLLMQRQLAELFLNSQLLRGIQSQADVAAMSGEKRGFALRAIHNALRCMDIALRGRHYAAGLPYGTHYTHVCAAFIASFLIRIARFFPDEMDLPRVAADVEEMAAVLSKLPAGRYARSLRLTLRKARREKIFPPSTRTGVATTSGPGSASDMTLAPTPSDWLTAFDLNPEDPAFGLMGITRDGPLPLFLNGDLGTTAAATDAVPFTGLEAFFMPAELDQLLTSLPSDVV